jgi:poly(A) polymerase
LDLENDIGCDFIFMIAFNIPFLPPNRKAWLVGGAIRDILLGQTPLDLDIVAADNAFQYARELALKLGTRPIKLGKDPLSIFRIVSPTYIFDVTNLNGSSIEEDLNQRDFCLNAIAWELPKGEMIDCTNGIKDIEKEMIRMVADTTFRKDPIRLLRAFRLACTLNFQIEKNTLSAIKKEAHLIKTTAAEKIQTELLKILNTPDCTETIILMKNTSILQNILPEVTELEQCHQNHHHDFDVYHHTIFALSALEKFLKDPNLIFEQKQTLLKTAKFTHNPGHLKLALLLHDVGKPTSRTITSDGLVHFYGHAKKSALMADQISRRLSLSNVQRTYITSIIQYHLYPMLLFLENQKGHLTQRAIIKFFRKANTVSLDLLLHASADFAAKKRSNDPIKVASNFISFFQKLLEYYHDYLESALKRAPLLTGKDLIKEFGLTPSPLFKIILDRIEEGRLTGQLCNKVDAIRWTKSFLAKHRNKHGS